MARSLQGYLTYVATRMTSVYITLARMRPPHPCLSLLVPTSADDLTSPTSPRQGVFPNLQSILLRIRYNWPQPLALAFTALPTPSTLPRNPLLLHKPEIAEFSWTPALGERWTSSRQMHQAIAASIKKLWGDLNMQSHLPMAEIGFKLLPIQAEWDESIPMESLLSL
jgi:hypothetical protein